MNTFEKEREQLSQLSIDLNNVMPQQDSQDSVVWLANEGGNYFVKSAYEVLQKSTPFIHSLAMETLWDIKALSNVFNISLENPIRKSTHKDESY